MPTRHVALLVVLSLLMGGLVGYGAARAGSSGNVLGRPPNVFGPTGPLGTPGAGLPALPPGVTVDEKGVIQGLNLAVEPGTQMLTWDTLRSFEYTMAVGMSALPEAVGAFDGERVTMLGFLMPNYEFDDIHQFALVGSHWSCCYGMPAGLNGTVNVTLAPGHAGLENTMDPLRVVGTFRVREVKESGWLVAIYSLEDAKAEKIR